MMMDELGCKKKSILEIQQLSHLASSERSGLICYKDGHEGMYRDHYTVVTHLLL